MNIAKVLKRRRQQLNITQAVLAKYIGFKHRSSIQKLEVEFIQWKFRDIVKACELLKININLTNVEDEIII